MKVYSDVLTVGFLRSTAREAGGIYMDSVVAIPSPKLRTNGWNIVTAGYTKRKKNTGLHGASDVYAATRDQHGNWFAKLYEIDPNAIICNYRSVSDFHAKTFNRYKPGDQTILSGLGSVTIA